MLLLARRGAICKLARVIPACIHPSSTMDKTKMKEGSEPKKMRHDETEAEDEDRKKVLGPLADLVGTWTGSNGLNVIAVPSRRSKPTDGGRYELIIRPYKETLTFTPVDNPVRNRGGSLDQYVGAVAYKTEVFATDDDPGLIHVETGMFFYLDTVLNNQDESPADKPPFSIARSATIPHGNSAMLLGTSKVTAGAPIIPNIDSTPQDVGTRAPPEFYSPYRKPLDVTNPNALLQKVISNQTIRRTTHISLDSKNKGGVNNIPFIVDRANTTGFQCDFWVETVEKEDGSTMKQLQYSQTIDIEFHKKIGGPEKDLISWPHVTINTLTKRQGK